VKPLGENRILIVDDTRENIIVLGEILSAYKRSIALNGEKALIIAKDQKPDLILLDIMMPEMDGFEVCKRLKDDPDTSSIPVIFITAKNQVEDEVRGLELGAIDFISKPISPPVVLARVRSHLELQQSKMELENRNIELKNTLEELSNTQAQLIHSEKMSALGQLVAGIAHEINTPLGAINSSNKSINFEIDTFVKNLQNVCYILSHEHKEIFFKLIDHAFSKTNSMTSREERQLRKNLIPQLEAKNIKDSFSIADTLVELGVYDNIEQYIPLLNDQRASDILHTAHILSSIKFSSNIINTAIEKVSKIVYSLKNFTRFDKEGNKELTDLNESIATVLTLYHNQLKQGIEIYKKFELDKLVAVVPDQINQVWTNVIHNAIHAMGGRGELRIRTYFEDDHACVSFNDTGRGMDEETKAKIFDPFFTTKPAGEGTGLGLDIVNKIIKNQNGQIKVESELGAGATFTFYLPIGEIS
jgi:two-component system, NtrC family, sensor kinase